MYMFSYVEGVSRVFCLAYDAAGEAAVRDADKGSWCEAPHQVHKENNREGIPVILCGVLQ